MNELEWLSYGYTTCVFHIFFFQTWGYWIWIFANSRAVTQQVHHLQSKHTHAYLCGKVNIIAPCRTHTRDPLTKKKKKSNSLMFHQLHRCTDKWNTLTGCTPSSASLIFVVEFLVYRVCWLTMRQFYLTCCPPPPSVTCRTCKAAVNTPKPQWLLHPADRLLPSTSIPYESCNCLSGMGGWCHWCFPVHCSCNGVNLAPHWAISVQPHAMKDTLVPPPPPSIPPSLVSFSHLWFTSCCSLWSPSLRLSSSVSYVPTFTCFFLCHSSSALSISHLNTAPFFLGYSKHSPPVNDIASHQDISIIILKSNENWSQKVLIKC